MLSITPPSRHAATIQSYLTGFLREPFLKVLGSVGESFARPKSTDAQRWRHVGYAATLRQVTLSIIVRVESVHCINFFFFLNF